MSLALRHVRSAHWSCWIADENASVKNKSIPPFTVLASFFSDGQIKGVSEWARTVWPHSYCRHLILSGMNADGQFSFRCWLCSMVSDVGSVTFSNFSYSHCSFSNFSSLKPKPRWVIQWMRNTKWFGLRRTSGHHLALPLAQSRVNSEIRASGSGPQVKLCISPVQDIPHLFGYFLQCWTMLMVKSFSLYLFRMLLVPLHHPAQKRGTSPSLCSPTS